MINTVIFILNINSKKLLYLAILDEKLTYFKYPNIIFEKKSFNRQKH